MPAIAFLLSLRCHDPRKFLTKRKSAGYCPHVDATVDQELFPFVETKVPEKSFFRKYIEASKEHGTLMTQALCAPAMGVSTQRVGQLIDNGKLASIEIDGRRFIPVAAVDLWLSEEKDKGGRPPKTLKEMWKRQVEIRKKTS